VVKAAETASKQAATADQALAAAKQRLADLETIDAAKKHLTVTEAVRLHDAQLKVVDATAKAAAAHQKSAAASQAAAGAGKLQGTVMTDLAAKLHGQASAAADTFTGRLAAIKAHLEDAAASFGQKYGPAITATGSGMALLGGVVSASKAVLDTFKTTEEGVTAATEAMSAAEDTAAVSEGLALAPILLIVGALALLGAAAYLIYRNWNTIWGGIKAVVKGVWDWIKTNWPLLVGILLGPIGIAAALIWKYWKYIWDGLKAVWNWIKTAWNDVYHAIADPIVKAFNAVVGFITGLPGKIAKIAAGMWHGISDAFKDTINFMIDLWNRLHFTLPKASFLGVHLGGETIGVPHIPHLAQGGLITQTGLVFAHAGEAITPIDKVPRGPAMYIETAHFNEPVDVNLLSKQLEFALSAGLPV
jgi:phage-related protein